MELKQEVEKCLQIPVAHQTILCCGRTLVDTKTLGAYKPGLRAGCKLTLVQKEPEALKDVMHKVFMRFHTEDQSERLTREFMADQERRVQALSLDDWERVAAFYLRRSGDGAIDAKADVKVEPAVVEVE